MRKNWGMIIFSLLLLGVLCALESGEKKAEVISEAVKENEKTYDLAYAVVSVGGEEIRIGSWQSGGGTHVLFLPWWCQQEEGIELYAAQELVVNGKRIPEGHAFRVKDENIIVERNGKQEELCLMYSSKLPSLWIEIDSNEFTEIQKVKETSAEVEVFYVAAEKAPVEEKRIKGSMHCRGNVTFTLAAKKSYLLETEAETDFGGMGAALKWILTSNYFDQTLLRNYMTVQFAKRMELGYTPESQFVDLYVNGSYQGLFLLGEKVEVNCERVAIKDLEAENEKVNSKDVLKMFPYDTEEIRGYRAKSPEDITGGYLLELEMDERWMEEDSGFRTQNGQCVVIQSPKHATADEVRYISELFQNFEDALLENTESDRYLEYVDLESFAKKYIIEEAAKNIDANKTSQYFYKYNDDVDTKLYAGPIWDYDKGWGNMGKLDTDIDLRVPEFFYANQNIYPHSIWPALYVHDSFQREVKRIWQDEASEALGEIIDQDLEKWRDEIFDSAGMDWMRWNAIRGEQDTDEKELYADSYEEAFEKLRAFALGRKEFLDTEWSECE